MSEQNVDGKLKVSIETIESVNFGDHAERLRRSHATVEGETVEALVRRVFASLSSGYSRHDATDEIVIRVVVGQDGKPIGQTELSSVPPW